MIIKKICILGGTGFVGRVLANRLSEAGYETRVLTRNREKHKNDLILLPKLQLVETNIHNQDMLNENLSGCDAVINLVGILNESGTDGSGFRIAHLDLTRSVIDSCKRLGIRRILHMSALNAAPDAPSHYLRSKGEAENLVHGSENIHVTSYRPSVIFGPEDSFFNRFATLLKLTPVFFPLACADARFAPVYVGNVADAMIKTLNNPYYYGKRLEICGPGTYTLKQLVEYTAKCAGMKRIVVPLPDILSRIQATMFDLAGFVFNLIGMQKPFSMDNYQSLKIDSVTSQNSLQTLGINPASIEAIVPQYLSPKFLNSPYDEFRRHSHRNQPL